RSIFSVRRLPRLEAGTKSRADFHQGPTQRVEARGRTRSTSPPSVTTRAVLRHTRGMSETMRGRRFEVNWSGFFWRSSIFEKNRWEAFTNGLTLLDQFFSRSRSRSARADPSQRESRRNRAPAASTAGWDAGRPGSRHSQKLRSRRLFSFSRRSDQVVLELVLGVGPQGRAPDPGSAVLVLSLDYGV